MTRISVVTPWLNAPELCRMYARGLRGAEVVIVDNGSGALAAERIETMVIELGGVYLRNEHNALFAEANNQGLAAATGEIVVFLNNDVECRAGFLHQVEQDVEDGALYGPSKLRKLDHDYLEGWCIAARREVWNALGGWDAEYFTGLYWEDNDLCFRAVRAGYNLIERPWPVWHFNNYTSGSVPGSMDHSAGNMHKFMERVRADA
jgi:GT2 family glycosyltransferase